MENKKAARTKKIKLIEIDREYPRRSRAATQGERTIVATMERRVGAAKAGVMIKTASVPAIAPARQASFKTSLLM